MTTEGISILINESGVGAVTTEGISMMSLGVVTMTTEVFNTINDQGGGVR